MESENKLKEKVNTRSSYFVILLEQYQWLRKESYETHRSMSAIIRDAINLLMQSKGYHL